MLAIGLGTGRCGTKSLAELLALNGFDCIHERKPALSWRDEPDPARHLRGRDGPFADVGFYYLPHVRRLAGEFERLRFVCLRRDRGATVDSLARVRPVGTNWFAGPGAPGVVPTGWDRCFPAHDDHDDFRAVAGRYWDDYYREAGRLASSLGPRRFRVYPTESLNCPKCVDELLRFVGVETPRVVTGIRVTH